jgi:16S rRNA (cytidine1402-2'-O)-methyltransferase
VSDAGTPAVSDPGARIVDAVRAAGLQVVPLPGASAAVAALSASGFVNDRFHFVGFLPAKAKQRETELAQLKLETSTLVIYEAPHRIIDCVEALAAVFEPDPPGRVRARADQDVRRNPPLPAVEALAWVKADQHRERGEFVVLVEGAPAGGRMRGCGGGADPEDPADRMLGEAGGEPGGADYGAEEECAV